MVPPYLALSMLFATPLFTITQAGGLHFEFTQPGVEGTQTGELERNKCTDIPRGMDWFKITQNNFVFDSSRTKTLSIFRGPGCKGDLLRAYGSAGHDNPTPEPGDVWEGNGEVAYSIVFGNKKSGWKVNSGIVWGAAAAAEHVLDDIRDHGKED